jgi:rubrerythrin
MRSLVNFADLDLRAAFDFAILIEEDAQARYAELSRRLGDAPGGAGRIFREMVAFEGRHQSDLVSRRNALFGGHPQRIDIPVGGPVEQPEVDDDDLPTSARRALEVAVAAERRAEAFYREVAPGVRDPAVRSFFEGLRRDEEAHAALLARKLAALGDEPATGEPTSPAPPAARAPAETFPDRALLEEALPRFDAATQAVATGIIVRGMSPAEVANALGVSRRAVSRKLAGFLSLARQGAVAAVAAAALSGCVGRLQHGDSTQQAMHAGASAAVPVAEAPACVAPAPPPGGAARVEVRVEPAHDAQSGLAARVHEQVARRMRGEDPAVHGRVARAILAESALARLDPLLVLALIHVESSFDPSAVSTAGAVGLMQLLEPTMRRELERSKLPAADPRDPVANVQAGVRYLRRLVDAFSDVDLALMAYNAGPNRIRGHLRAGEIPARFHGYPRKVKSELERLKRSAGASSMVASADVRARPSG